jgi:hypothetical protein
MRLKQLGDSDLQVSEVNSAFAWNFTFFFDISCN